MGIVWACNVLFGFFLTDSVIKCIRYVYRYLLVSYLNSVKMYRVWHVAADHCCEPDHRQVDIH